MAMEAREIFEAVSSNLRDMLSQRGLGLYIPPYQRFYGWDKEKVAKLLDDILHGFMALIDHDDSFTFLGTVITIHDINYTTVQPIVRQEVPGKVLTVIDGQQRLTTLLLLCLALHNHVRVARAKLLKRRKREDLVGPEAWLADEANQVISDLESAFIERQASGDSPLYPRMIRAFSDQWSKKKDTAKYTSPVASLISVYGAGLSEPAAKEFKPKAETPSQGEDALFDRYSQISKLLKSVASGNAKRDLEELPSISQILRSRCLQLALLNHELTQDVSTLLRSQEPSGEFKGLFYLVLLSSYVMTRVAVTAVRGKTEDYAFTIFESLNTTGEPLTAFETFKPRVVSAEKLEKYEGSKARTCIDDVSNYLSQFQVGIQLQAATSDLLIHFAATETGTKLSKRLADQRRYLKDEFERYEESEADRLAFVRCLRDVSLFMGSTWMVDPTKSPHLPGLPVKAVTDAVKLCLIFLAQLKHSITIGPLVRFYSAAVSAPEGLTGARCEDFEGALKALTAFSALWRASSRGTENIDQEYRDIMSGAGALTGLPALARSLKASAPESSLTPIVDLEMLKAELRARLAHSEHGAVADKGAFISQAAKLPIGNSRSVARLLLLAAYHDAIPSTSVPGLIEKGKTAVSPCLTFEAFSDSRYLSLEHVAPQSQSSGWDIRIWEDKDRIQQIGNLLFVQLEANAMFSNRSWADKRVLYSVLGAVSHVEAKNVLDASGLDVSERAQEIIEQSKHFPHLVAISKKEGDWTLEFVEERSRVLLGFAWDELYSWLEPSETSS